MQPDELLRRDAGVVFEILDEMALIMVSLLYDELNQSIFLPAVKR